MTLTELIDKLTALSTKYQESGGDPSKLEVIVTGLYGSSIWLDDANLCIREDDTNPNNTMTCFIETSLSTG